MASGRPKYPAYEIVSTKCR